MVLTVECVVLADGELWAGSAGCGWMVRRLGCCCGRGLDLFGVLDLLDKSVKSVILFFKFDFGYLSFRWCRCVDMHTAHHHILVYP